MPDNLKWSEVWETTNNLEETRETRHLIRKLILVDEKLAICPPEWKESLEADRQKIRLELIPPLGEEKANKLTQQYYV
jgi:hypothetical protein